ncbi:MAG: pyruvate formate lyase family protein [Cellulosilyticaceae bacterium]
MTNYRLFEAELAFTKAYKAHKDADKSLREAKCMEAQMPYTFGMPREGDLFGGRFLGYRIGFFPLMLGGRIYDGYDKLCYCCDVAGAKHVIQEMKAEGSYSQAEIQEAEEALAFWEQEETYHHIKEAFTEDFHQHLTGDYYHTEIGAVYPLYRIAGAHLDFKKLLTYGLNGLIELIEEEKKHHQDEEAQNLYTGMVQVLTVMQHLCKERAELLRAQGYTPSLVADDLEWISANKPETMHQAMQLCLVYAICAGATEMARMDDYMGPFYVRDIQEGIITREEAKAYLVNYFKIYEECFGRDTRCIIGGFGRENEEEADEMALLILDAIDGRQILYPQVSLRYYKGMNEKVYDKALDVLGKGNTFPLLYNDDVNVAGTMRAMDVPRKVAEQYGFFGCGEYMLANKSIGTPNTCLNMPKVLELVLNEGIDPLTGKQIGPVFPAITADTTYEELWARYQEGVAFFANYCGDVQALVYDKCGEQSSFLLMSILHDDCIKRGKGLFNGGLHHMGGTVETYGNMTVANSLAAIKKVVYEDKAFNIECLKEMVDKNFEGYEKEQQMLLDAPKYGNNIDMVDEIAIAVHENVCHNMRDQKHRTNLDSFLVVIINNNMNVLLGKRVGATPDGRLSGVYLSNGNAAYPGDDKKGMTALMQSLAKLDVSIHAGANTNLKFSTSLFNDQRAKMKMLLETYFELGGQQGNISVVNQEDLVKAVQEPEKYQNLMVRVGGFTAQFVTLDKETQEEILARTAY